jgi:hypothetical protein
MAKTAEFDKCCPVPPFGAVSPPAFLYLIWKYLRNVIYLRTRVRHFRRPERKREQYEFHR